ncbi:MAG TPA: adenylate/guanylate cyclase domain-containing protein, partial [Verrucomicrobiae bacterium]
MTFKPAKHAPVIVAVVVIMLVCFLQILRLDFFERLERMTYDLRAKAALEFPAPASTNLAFVSIEESSIDAVLHGKVGFHFGLLWPRQVYGRLIDELTSEGAKAVGFDVLFGELRPDNPPVEMANGALVESDAYFAAQMKQASNVVIAVTPGVWPVPDLFATNVFELADISTEKDSDGVLRRVKAFRVYRRWHPYLEEKASEYGLNLDQAKILPGKIVLPQNDSTNLVEIPIDAQTNFAPHARAYTDVRVWHMGVILAALQLGLDLSKAELDLAHGKIILRGPNGVERTIPVDAEGYFYVDWRMTPNDNRLLRAPIEALLWQDEQRLEGKTNSLSDAFRNRLVVVGSAVEGNDLTDQGATPLERNTLLVSTHWNVANSIIMNQFIRRMSTVGDLLLIIIFGVLTALFTLGFRSAILGSATVVFLIIVYAAIAFYAFVHFRLWLPLVFPVLGAVLVQHLSLVTWRAIFEEGEKRRIKSVFSKIVAPDVVSELLRAEKLSLGGARREVTAFFADVRGFTALTDEAQERSAKFVKEHQLDTKAAEAHSDESARETLNTINTYLGLVADTVITGGGTLDKYIGDCVMAFWGAPVANPNHAVGCVRAAIEAQRGIYRMNQQRRTENERRAAENTLRTVSGEMDRPLLPILTLGCGINTGVVDVGLMGSEIHQINYTIFGREVNLASRLEGVSGSARIIIGEATYRNVLKDDPALAATCIELPPVKVKGILDAVKIYEVPW